MAMSAQLRKEATEPSGHICRSVDWQILEVRRKIPGIWAAVGFLCIEQQYFQGRLYLVDKHLNIKSKKKMVH